MTAAREKFSSRARPELLSEVHEIPNSDGRQRLNVRPEVMAHFHASLERNRRLGELLAKS